MEGPRPNHPLTGPPQGTEGVWDRAQWVAGGSLHSVPPTMGRGWHRDPPSQMQ